MIGRAPVVLEELCLLALFVDRCRQAFDHCFEGLVIRSRQDEQVRVGIFSVHVRRGIYRRVGNHGPGGAQQRRIGSGINLNELFRCRDRQREIFHLVKIVRGGAKHYGSLFVVRVCVCEP